ncbi:phosphate ABC transporter permease [Haloarchaeobius amylolyticus]|uniref:phosphate ABC transporter permease n=1 Tax=Haloarchaeobius amylolyticus TaxID=1198296 RepID=UPI00226F680E|nr:phosphate ABC transporter permease [Haloarchaeobius amylolyticus]
MSNSALDHWGTRTRGVVTTVADGLPVAPRTAAGLLAVVPAAAVFLLRLAVNAPLRNPVVGAELLAPVSVAALLGPAAAALVLGASADFASPAERVGLLFVGVFGVLAALSTAAWLPAAGAVVGGGSLAVAARIRNLDRRADPLELVASAVVLLGLGLSLAASSGVATDLRTTGTTVGLLGIALAPAFRARHLDWPGLGAGALAAVAVYQAATSAPYIAGAALLVGSNVVGGSVLLVALAAGGGVAATVAATRTGAWPVALGAILLLVVGVPATIPRAVGAVVALALLVSESGPVTESRGEPA